jgi:hypothetical protein
MNARAPASISRNSTVAESSCQKLEHGTLWSRNSHVFVYLVTDPKPMDFRLFLLRHIALLRGLFRWTNRLLIPRRLWKARLVYCPPPTSTRSSAY